jgi:hypothetical protein
MPRNEFLPLIFKCLVSKMTIVMFARHKLTIFLHLKFVSCLYYTITLSYRYIYQQQLNCVRRVISIRVLSH